MERENKTMNFAEKLLLIAEQQQEKKLKKELFKFFNNFLYNLLETVANRGETYIDFNLYSSYYNNIVCSKISLGEDFTNDFIYNENIELDGAILKTFLENNGFYCKLSQIGTKEGYIIRNYFQISFIPFSFEENNVNYCISSKGEEKIEELLKNNYTPYRKQYTFCNCKYKKELPFDFAIFNGNHELQYLIEYDGEPHFKFIEHFHKTQEGFQLQQLRDHIKTNYCQINHIPLIRIPYTRFNDLCINDLLLETTQFRVA